jgi:hypothetical protein
MSKQQQMTDGVYVVYHKDVQMKMFAKRCDGRWYYFGPGYADMGDDGENGYPCSGEDEFIEILAGPLETYTITPDSCGGDEETIERTIQAVNRFDELTKALIVAVTTIKALHGEAGWDIYYEHSPEMKIIRKAIVKEEGETP